MYKKLNNKKVELNPWCPGRFGGGGWRLRENPGIKISVFLERDFVLLHGNLNLVLREKSALNIFRRGHLYKEQNVAKNEEPATKLQLSK